MRRTLSPLGLSLALSLSVAGCVTPSRTAVFGPVEREIDQRLGASVGWGDAKLEQAVAELLERPLDQQAAVRIALAKNKRLQAEYDRLGIAASEVAAATVLAPTEVDLETQLGGEGDDEVRFGIDVTQDILDLLQMPQRRGVARAELAAARARAVATTIELVATAEATFVDLLAAQQALELRQTAFDAASASAEIVERMYAAGNATDLELARERDRREQTRIELSRAQLDVELAREALNDVLGLSGKETRWTAQGRLPDVPKEPPALDAIERDAIAASLEIAAIRAEAEAAAGRLGIARLRAWLPELGVGASIEREDGAWHAGPALSIGLPIFNQQQGPRARANAELRQARNRATATAIELRAAARAARQRVLQAHSEARHLFEAVLPLRQRIVDETLKQYNAMNATTFELLTTRRELVEGGSQYIDAVRRFWRASAEARALQRGGFPRLGTEQRAQTSPSSSALPAPGGH